MDMNMEFSDSEPYDIPIGDLLGSDCEDNNAKVKPQEVVDFVDETMSTIKAKSRKKKEERRKIIMQRRFKGRADAVREGERREKWITDGEQTKNVPLKKRKASKEDEKGGEYLEYWDVGEKKEEKQEDGKILLKGRERNLQTCQQDCQVNIDFLKKSQKVDLQFKSLLRLSKL